VFTLVTERERKAESVNWPAKAVHWFNEPRSFDSMCLTQNDVTKSKLNFVPKVPLPSATLHKLSRMKLKARGLTDEGLSMRYPWGIILAQSNVEIINGISKKFIHCLLGYILDRI